MRIVKFRIENFRNLKVVECSELPDFMVICGGNGCGKSALLEALMTAKEYVGAYGNFRFDPRVVSANAEKATITLDLKFTEKEREFVRDRFNRECPEMDEIIVEIHKGGSGRVTKRSRSITDLLSHYSHSLGSPGFFDFINAYRRMRKLDLKTWDSSFLSDQRTKGTLAISEDKFQDTKRYLAALKMRDLQNIQKASRSGTEITNDSLDEIRTFFDNFFKPMKFEDVDITTSPFNFSISTPMGEIDIDDLSSGEKEVLNIFIRFHQLKPQGAVILFDEADAHLHPDLERRYLNLLRELTQGSQLILTTHSPEMMISAGTESLYTILKNPPKEGGNQLKRVTHNEDLHNALSELMGSRGIVSFNQKIIFIEGEEASADQAIYEAFYPPSQYNISFVPARDSVFIQKTTERINDLLTASVGFQYFYSIIDGDLERIFPKTSKKLYRLPVYHVENFLLIEEQILKVSQEFMGQNCPFNTVDEISNELKKLLFDDVHLNPYTRAIFSNKLVIVAKEINDIIFKKKEIKVDVKRPDFTETAKEAKLKLEEACSDDKWKAECKGRALLRAYCSKHDGITYKHFRNSLISKIESPPIGLKKIMDNILND